MSTAIERLTAALELGFDPKQWQGRMREQATVVAADDLAAVLAVVDAVDVLSTFYDALETYDDGERGMTQLDHGHEEYEARMDVFAALDLAAPR